MPAEQDGDGIWSLRTIENSVRRVWFCVAQEKLNADSLLVAELDGGRFWLQFADQTLMEDRVVLLGGLRPLYD